MIVTIVDIVTSIFGGVSGFGLYGIMFILLILVFLVMLSVYALVIILALMAISYGTRLWLEKITKQATEQLTRDAREVGRKYLQSNQPKLINGDSNLTEIYPKLIDSESSSLLENN